MTGEDDKRCAGRAARHTADVPICIGRLGAADIDREDIHG